MPLLGDPRPRCRISKLFFRRPGVFVVGVFDVTENDERLAPRCRARGIDLAIYRGFWRGETDLVTGRGLAILGEVVGPRRLRPVPIDVAGRRWTLSLSVPHAWRSPIVSLAGVDGAPPAACSFTALLGAFLLVLTGRTAFVEGMCASERRISSAPAEERAARPRDSVPAKSATACSPRTRRTSSLATGCPGS